MLNTLLTYKYQDISYLSHFYVSNHVIYTPKLFPTEEKILTLHHIYMTIKEECSLYYILWHDKKAVFNVFLNDINNKKTKPP